MWENRGRARISATHAASKRVTHRTLQHPSDARPPKIDSPMTYWLDEPRYQHQLVTVRTLWVTIALSLLVHFAPLLVAVPKTHLLAPGGGGTEAATDRLPVRPAAPEPPPPQGSEPRAP